MEFDPYQKWLEIPRDRRPPTYYDLLGLEAFSDDSQAARAAHRERYSKVRTFELGTYGEQATQLLNELTLALDCLLDPDKKRAYDQTLGRSSQAETVAEAPPSKTQVDQPKPPVAIPAPPPRKTKITPPPIIAPVEAPPVAAPVQVLPVAAPVQVLPVAASVAPLVSAVTAPVTDDNAPTPVRVRPLPGRRWLAPVGFGGGVFLALILLVSSYSSDQPANPTSTANAAATDQTAEHGSVSSGEAKSPEVALPDEETEAAASTDAESPTVTPTAQPSPEPPPKTAETAAPPAPPQYALRLDGESQIEILNTEHLDATEGGFTVEGWLRMPPASQPNALFNTFTRPVRKDSAQALPSSGWSLALQKPRSSSSALSYAIVSPQTKRSTGVSSQTVSFDDGRWRHVALCVSAESAEVFLDGRRVLIRQRMPLPVSSSGPLLVGANLAQSTTAAPLWGDLCGLRVSAGRRYRESFQPPADMALVNDAATLSLLDFSQYSPNGLVPDVSGHERNGKITGGQWITLNSSLPGLASASPKIAPSPGPSTLPTELPKPSPEQKLAAVPSEAQLTEARQKVRDTFAAQIGGARDAAKKLALARQFDSAAIRTQGDPISQYATFLEAHDFAAQAGSPDVALSIDDSIAARFEVDAWALKLETMRKLRASATTKTLRRELAQKAVQMAEDAVTASDDRLDVAEKLLEEAAALATRTRDTALLKQARAWLKEINAEIELWRVARQARQTLSQNANDPAANLTLGKYLCFVRGEWSEGLPLLAKGSDPAYRNLAQLEDRSPASAEQRTELGDQWVKLAQSKGPETVEHNGAKFRALHWYQLALPALSGSEKDRIERRTEELAKTTRPPGVRFGGRVAWFGDAPGEVRVLRGHTSDITALSVARSGKTLLSCSRDGTLRLWDLPTGREIRQFPSNATQFQTVAISPDAGFVFAGAQTAPGVFVWNAQTGELVKALPTSFLVQRILLSPDGQTLAWFSGAPFGRANLGLLELRTQTTSVLNVPGLVTDMAFSRDGRFLATAARDNAVRVWNLRTLKQVESYLGHTGAVTAVAFSPSGRLIASTGDDTTIRVWDAQNGREKQSIKVDRAIDCGIRFLGDDRRLLCTSSSSGVAIYDLQTASIVETVQPVRGVVFSTIRCVTVLPDPRGVVIGGGDGAIHVCARAIGQVARPPSWPLAPRACPASAWSRLTPGAAATITAM